MVRGSCSYFVFRGGGRVVDSILLAGNARSIQHLDLLRNSVLQIYGLDFGQPIEGREPKKLLFFSSAEKMVLSVVRLQRKGELPLARDVILGNHVAFDGVNVEKLLERNPNHFLRNDRVLNYKRLRYGVQNIVPLVIKTHRVEFNFLGHLIHVTFNFVFRVL